MALTVRRADKVNSFGSNAASPIQRSSMVMLKVYNKDFKDRCDNKRQVPKWAEEGFWVLNIEPFSVNISTSWKNNAGAEVVKTMNDLVDSTIIKILNGEQLFQPIATDGWSQQILEKGSPISTRLKFRVYLNGKDGRNEQAGWCNGNSTDLTYENLIRFFTRVCTPPKQYSLWTGAVSNITGAAKNAAQTVKDIKTASTDYDKDGNETGVNFGKAAKYFVAAAAQSVGFDEPGELGKGAIRGQFTFTIETEKFGCPSLDWILKSFAWTPSQQLQFSDSLPKPLWIDFELEFETNICPSNAYVARFMTKNRAPIKNAAKPEQIQEEDEYEYEPSPSSSISPMTSSSSSSP